MELLLTLFFAISLLFIIVGVYRLLFQIGKSLQEAGQELENQKLFNAGIIFQWLIKFSLYFNIFCLVAFSLLFITEFSEFIIALITTVSLVISLSLYVNTKKDSSNNNQKSNVL